MNPINEKKLNLTGLIYFAACRLAVTQKHKKNTPPIYYNNDQNYKFDDDEILEKNTEERLKKAQPIKDKLKKPKR